MQCEEILSEMYGKSNCWASKWKCPRVCKLVQGVQWIDKVHTGVQHVIAGNNISRVTADVKTLNFGDRLQCRNSECWCLLLSEVSWRSSHVVSYISKDLYFCEGVDLRDFLIRFLKFLIWQSQGTFFCHNIEMTGSLKTTLQVETHKLWENRRSNT